MLIGSFFAVVGSYVTGSAWMGLLFAALSGILMGLVLVTLTVGFKCEHVLAGVGINIFASGITIVLLEMIWGTKGKSGMVAGLGMLRVPLISKNSRHWGYYRDHFTPVLHPGPLRLSSLVPLIQDAGRPENPGHRREP